MWLEPLGANLPWKIETDTLLAVRITQFTAADTLGWMYRHWTGVPDSTWFDRMFAVFPDNTRLLREFFWKYYNEANCDSLTRVGEHLIEVWQSGESTYLMDNMSEFSVDQASEDVQERIEDICVEGQPQPTKALGWSGVGIHIRE
ncbi:hypothetical protein KQI52_12660 [bacterium]|nr:hypothetical protein [bacterium]